MSVIRKLLIQGVRSFDPQNQDIIEFYTPLTIIVGQNGCGKTTIIECLKYITTGELPPNSKGGAFIHDPKLVGEKEVKAQVKLRFNNISHRSMTCVRSILLTQKKLTLTQKTLEGALSFDATATEGKVSISSRCADLDATLPEQLGVSKAVLENVIFCHQEESNWPLSESSVLKKRFDEIFSATRYTKALDSIKTIRKEQTTGIRVSRNELRHLEEKKVKSEGVRSQYEKSTASIHQYRGRIDEIQHQEAQVTEQIEALAEQLQEYMGLQTTIEGLQLNLDQRISSYKEMEANTSVMDVGGDELDRMSAEVARQIETQESDIQQKRRERDQLQRQISQLQVQVNDTLAEIGRLRAAQDSLDQKVAGRTAAVSELCVTFSITLAAAQEPEALAARCTEEIELRLTTAETERAEAQVWAEESEKTLRGAIDATQSQIHSFNNAATVCERQIAANQTEIRGLKTRLESQRVDSAEEKELEARLETEKGRLEQLQGQDPESTYHASAKQKRVELATIADEIARINAEISHNNRQADTRAKLSLKRKELEGKDTQWDSLRDTPGMADYTPSTQTPFGSERERAAAIKDAIAAKKQAIADCTARSKECHNTLSSTRMRLKLARQSYDDQAKDAAAKTERIGQVCKPSEFDEVYADAQSELHELAEEAGQYKSASSMYRAFIKKVETDHTCPICQRGWSSKDHEEQVVKKLRVDYTKAPTELLRIEGEIRDAERRVEALSNLKSAVHDVNEWESAKADLESQIKELTATEELAVTEADDADCEGVVHSSELETMAAHLAKAQELVTLEESRKDMRSIVEALEHELQATGSTKTIDELQAEVSAYQAQDAAARRELERLNQELLLKQKEIGFRQDSVRKTRDELSEFKHRASECAAIKQRISDLESKIASSEAESKEAYSRANALAPQLQEDQKQLAAFRSEVRAKEAGIDKRVRDLVQARDRLSLMTSEIEQTRQMLRCAPGDDKYPDRLAMANAQRESLAAESTRHSNELSSVESTLQESDRISVKLAAKQRQISDNIRLRTNLADQKRIEADLKTAQENQAHLETQLSEIYDDSATVVEGSDDGTDIEGSRKRRRGGDQATQGPTRRRGGAQLQHRRNALNAKLSQLTSERAGLQGEVKQLEDQARRLARELSTDYKDIEALYVRQLVQCKTEELAHEDLETYGKALDAAIMRYHSLKMQDINKIIRELWINTYQGSDIDTIEIRSEVEGARNSRSHNYRVVMIKGGHAIDMRGRCSAGQKVLACLIIRLALAETFSVNCGILALDEPTTNLDQENIDSLAHSLARIIKSRQEQRNFQLIVITHDEIFMQLLGKSEYADYYWRVYKDENQCSVFARRPIANN
ncbi:DNA repair protein rad50 [Coemansia sp. RSA 552]|nr:DNA repair protein rad50 [Coemansia sp. RSA 552]